MAKFKDDNLDLLTGQYVDFDDANLVHMGYDDGELYVNTTLSGLRAGLNHLPWCPVAQLYRAVGYSCDLQWLSRKNSYS